MTPGVTRYLIFGTNGSIGTLLFVDRRFFSPGLLAGDVVSNYSHHVLVLIIVLASGPDSSSAYLIPGAGALHRRLYSIP